MQFNAGHAVIDGFTALCWEYFEAQLSIFET